MASTRAGSAGCCAHCSGADRWRGRCRRRYGRSHRRPLLRRGSCMGARSDSDDVLLAARDAASFECFYVRHVDALLGFFQRRTRNPEMAADLTAETFAAALAGRRRYRPEAGAASAWLYGIALKKLADAQRSGCAEQSARRRLGMERLGLTDADIPGIQRPGEGGAVS